MSVTAAQGFVAAGVRAGIRRSALDLAVVHSLEPCVGGAVWTTNRVQAAPVLVSRRNLEKAEPRAVVVNSGVANAATGAAGIADAERMGAQTAGLLGLAPEEVIVLSTGVIGIPLPMERITAGIDAAVSELSRDGGGAAAKAILTTDSGPKLATVSGDGFTVGGIAKGAGMIHPQLATMLAVLTTDYPLEAGEPLELLRPTVEASFNRISVDGECSTNDAVVLIANGVAGIERSTESDRAFAASLAAVCADLARQIVADGEGATTLIEVTVTGASSEEEAVAVARRVATSPLVKTAAFGRDPNWGRVLAAAGSAPWNGGFAQLDPDSVSLSFDDVLVFDQGTPTGLQPELGGPAVTIRLDLGLGTGSAAYLASDLTYDYVRLNAEYTT